MSLLVSQLVDESTFTEAGGLLAPDQTGRRITGRRVLLEWIVRSWLQPRGGNRLAPNDGADIRRLENATIDDRMREWWRVALGAAAVKACIGYLLSIDVDVSFANRTTTIAGRAAFLDGSASTLAVSMTGAALAVKFGGAQ